MSEDGKIQPGAVDVSFGWLQDQIAAAEARGRERGQVVLLDAIRRVLTRHASIGTLCEADELELRRVLESTGGGGNDG